MIEFLWKEQVVGRHELPNFTRIKERHEIARRLRIKRYDSFRFCGNSCKASRRFFYTAYGAISFIRREIRSYNPKKDNTNYCIQFMLPEEYVKMPRWVQ